MGGEGDRMGGEEGGEGRKKWFGGKGKRRAGGRLGRLGARGMERGGGKMWEGPGKRKNKSVKMRMVDFVSRIGMALSVQPRTASKTLLNISLSLSSVAWPAQTRRALGIRNFPQRVVTLHVRLQ